MIYMHIDIDRYYYSIRHDGSIYKYTLAHALDKRIIVSKDLAVTGKFFCVCLARIPYIHYKYINIHINTYVQITANAVEIPSIAASERTGFI